MDAAPMIARCLQLQTDEIQAPWLPNPPTERLPQEVYGPCFTEWCDRCGCNHGIVNLYPPPPEP